MPTLAPLDEELIATLSQTDEPSVEKLTEKTSRPSDLIKESIEHRLNRRYIDIGDSGRIELTEAGERVAKESPLTG